MTSHNAGTYVRDHIKNAQSIGVIIGTSVSAAMLMLIGGVNLYVAAKLLKRWRALKKERKHEQELIRTGGLAEARKVSEDEKEHDDGPHAHDGGISHTHMVQVTEGAEVEGPGFLTKCCPIVFKAIDQPWKMYPIGFLFGLGFDTVRVYIRTPRPFKYIASDF